jgi:hypothetical protein
MHAKCDDDGTRWLVYESDYWSLPCEVVDHRETADKRGVGRDKTMGNMDLAPVIRGEMVLIDWRQR